VNPTRDDICSRLATRAFGEPLVSNMYRGLVVEAIVSYALPDWIWCSADWAGWDFKHEDNTKLEVKQSAALQTWSKGGRVTKCSFGIASATGYYHERGVWIPEAGRPSSIYVFGHHPGTDPTTTDQRDPEQWRFYCLPSKALPKDAASIGLRALDALSLQVWQDSASLQRFPCRFDRLAETVEDLRISSKPQSGLE
jgi:hypothetical protein